MSKKAKKNRTPTEKKRFYTKVKYATFGGEFLSVITPFLIIGIVKFNDYFVEFDGTRMSIACVLACALMGLTVWLVASKKFENSFISLIIGYATVDFIFFLIGKVINDIAWIMLFGLMGLLGSLGLDVASKKADAKIKEIDSAIKEAQKEQTKEEYREEAKKEEENKNSKVRF